MGTLERYRGVALFRRSVRQVTLTETRRDYLAAIRDALEQIGTATDRVPRTQAAPMLTVSTAPAFAAGWLVPRLMGFNLAHDAISVEAAAAGAGVVMAVRRVVASQLREGRLIAPFEQTVTTNYAY